MTLSRPTIAGIVRADLLIRLRRTSTVALLLLMSVAAYFTVADPATGTTLMQVGRARVLYNSAAIATGTAVVAAILIGIFGFYLVSNAVRRDLETRAGFVLAGTPVTNLEYLLGKFAGNIAYLCTVTLGYLGAVLLMHLLRGEAPLEPGTYLATYLALLGPPILFVSGTALFFECCPPLAGRLGDVIYFFLWALVLGVAAAMSQQGQGADWVSLLDVFGLRFVFGSIDAMMPSGARGVSVGHTPFDPSLAPFVLKGFVWTGSIVLDRLAACGSSLVMLGGALLFFPRFDPARVRGPRLASRGSLLARLNGGLKVLTRPLGALVRAGPARAGLPGWFGRVWADAVLTFMLTPLTLVALVLSAAAGILLPWASIRAGLLPVVFYLLIVALAEIPTRDRTAGTMGLLRATPVLDRHYLWWKLGTALLVTVTFLLVPFARMLIADPVSAAALLGGVFFTAGLATGLGSLTGSPKAFAAIFLFFLYLVQSSGGAPGFDFAGWYGRATVTGTLGYVAVASGLLLAAWAWERWRARAR